LKHLLNYYRECGVFVRLARRAVNQANYNRNEISILKIPIPEYHEQVEIASYIDLAEQYLSNFINKKRILYELFLNLLQQLLTAEIRINDFNISELNRKIKNP
jgi:type I restriction enzyme S subunit